MSKYVGLLADGYVEVTREGDPEDKWDHDDTHTDWTFTGLKLSDKDTYRALPVPDDVNIGDTVYAVIAVYSTGDTFGNSSGSELELVSIHKSEELAKKNVTKLQSENKDERYSMEIELDNGEVLKRYCPWDGYFESLDYVEYRKFTIE